MQGREAVVFRGDRGGVSVLVDRDAPLGVVVEELRRKLSSAGDFFAGASIRLDAGDRPLDDVEKRVLHELISCPRLDFVGRGHACGAASAAGAGGSRVPPRADGERRLRGRCPPGGVAGPAGGRAVSAGAADAALGAAFGV